MAKELKRVNKGDPITAEGFNHMVEEIRRLGRVHVGNGLGFRSTASGHQFWLTERTEHWVGEIVCCGECDESEHCCEPADEGDCEICPPENADGCCCCDEGTCDDPECCYTGFKDNRYWVVKCRLANTESDPFCAKAVWEKLPVCHKDFKKVAATNLQENTCGTHKLRPGTLVHVYEKYDDGNPSTLRYYFVQGLGPKEEDEDCGERNCDCPKPSSSSSSSSTSKSESGSGSRSHSGSGSVGCCECYEITINGGEKHQLTKNPAFSKTWSGDGYTITYDGKWIMGGPAIAREALTNDPCPPLDVAQWNPTGEGDLEEINCCEEDPSKGGSSSGSGSGGSGDGSGGGPCNAVTSVVPRFDGCKLVLDLTYCDGSTSSTDPVDVPCCCGSCSCGSCSTPSCPSCSSQSCCECVQRFTADYDCDYGWGEVTADGERQIKTCGSVTYESWTMAEATPNGCRYEFWRSLGTIPCGDSSACAEREEPQTPEVPGFIPDCCGSSGDGVGGNVAMMMTATQRLAADDSKAISEVIEGFAKVVYFPFGKTVYECAYRGDAYELDDLRMTPKVAKEQLGLPMANVTGATLDDTAKEAIAEHKRSLKLEEKTAKLAHKLAKEDAEPTPEPEAPKPEPAKAQRKTGGCGACAKKAAARKINSARRK